MTSDYIVLILANQRRQDFAAEAAADRLARLATADRTPWWHRVGHGLLSRPARRVARPRVAH